MSIRDSSAVTLQASIRDGSVSAEELTQSCLEAISYDAESVGAFLHVDELGALEQARAVDRRIQSGADVGPLAGIPVAIKDLLCTTDQPTTCASRMLQEFTPAYDATVVARLRAADAVLIGKTNMDEFAMGGSTESSALGRTSNPWDPKRVPGGSSGGAAACIAADMVPLSLGSDTGGSIRQPAAFCGVTGLKPTYGRVSRYGLIAFASSLDQVGPLARSAQDLALLLGVVAGHDPRDSTSADVPVPDYLAGLQGGVAGRKVGILRRQLTADVDSEIVAAVEQAIQQYERMGVEFVDIELPHSRYGIATYYVIAPSEASSNLARYDGVHYGFRADETTIAASLKGHEERADESPLVSMYRTTRAEGFGAEVKRRIMLGTYALSAGYDHEYYLKALRVRRLIRDDYDRAFEKVDLLLGPVTPAPPFLMGEKEGDPLSMYLGDLFTVTTNLAGLPGISVPCGFTSSGLPIGLQLQAPPFAEDRLLQAAHAYQRETDWHTRRPQV